MSENGAVFDAYNFSGLSDEERFQAIESIMLDVQSEYPDYREHLSKKQIQLKENKRC